MSSKTYKLFFLCAITFLEKCRILPKIFLNVTSCFSHEPCATRRTASCFSRVFTVTGSVLTWRASRGSWCERSARRCGWRGCSHVRRHPLCSGCSRVRRHPPAPLPPAASESSTASGDRFRGFMRPGFRSLLTAATAAADTLRISFSVCGPPVVWVMNQGFKARVSFRVRIKE